MREFVGAERFHLGLSASEQELLALIIDILQRGPARAASLKDAEQADAVLILGEDVPDTAPRLALSLRQAVRQKSLETADRMKIPRWQDAAVRNAAQQERSPLFIATPDATRLDDVATCTFRGAPDDLARLGFAVAHEIDAASARSSRSSGRRWRACATDRRSAQEREAPARCDRHWMRQRGRDPGRGECSLGAVPDGRQAELSFAVPECNSLGLSLIGGGTLQDAFEAVEQGAAETVIVLENDLYRRAERAAVDRCLDRARHVVVIDHLLHETARNAEIALPAGTFTEAEGTLVSNEGRAQRFFQLLVPEGDIQESWRWLRDLLHASGRESGWTRLDDVTAACAKALPTLAAIPHAAPGADFRINGAKFVAKRIVPAAVPRSTLRSPCTSPSRPRIRIHRSPIPWRAITARCHPPLSPISGLRHGIPCGRSTNSRTRWVARCAAAIRASVSSSRLGRCAALF